MSLKHITFTGIDEKTDITALEEIQKQYPIVEFGVLTSYHWNENGNRYLNPAFMSLLYGSGLKGDLNLALHICGSAAHDAATGDWDKIDRFTHRCLCMFNRIQLNIANRKNNPKHCWMPSVVGQEIIIQQRNVNELDLFNYTMEEHKHRLSIGSFSVLLDASGGRGIDTPIEVLKGNYKVGYAGGMNLQTWCIVEDITTFDTETNQFEIPNGYQVDAEVVAWKYADGKRNTVEILDNYAMSGNYILRR